MTEQRDFRKELEGTVLMENVPQFIGDILDDMDRLKAERDGVWYQMQRGLSLLNEQKAENEALRARVKELEERLKPKKEVSIFEPFNGNGNERFLEGDGF